MNKLPDFFIVGASKAGTTAICNSLASHPNICFSEKKEPNFFSEFDTSLEGIPDDQFLAYKKLFHIHSSMELSGEGSVKYLTSYNAVYWIKKYIPSAKIIIILRNPIERIISLYEMYSRLDKMKMTPEKAFTEKSYLVKQCMMYESIMRWINAFSREQVFIMIFDDFRENPMQEFKKLCLFLGLEENMNSIVDIKNRGGVPKSKILGLLANRNLIQVAKKVLPKSKHTKIDNFIKRAFFRKISLTSNQKKELESIFYTDITKIGNLIDRDLSFTWEIFDS